MKLYLLLALLVSSVTTVLSSPLLPRQTNTTTCPDGLLQRKSWHALSLPERRAYISAELCLIWTQPSAGKLPPSTSLFEDLIKLHQLQSNTIHRTGYFLPFHRAHVYAHELLLREKCNYQGAQPYWDEPVDAGNFSRSILFATDDTGFGGDGGPRRPLDPRPGCIITGPFRNLTLNVGPGFSDEVHCLSRAISNVASLGSSREKVEDCLRVEGFERAWRCIEADDGPHGGGHRGVGGEMNNAISSPGDPFFYLHHAFIDKLWWDWQKQKIPERLMDISGPRTVGGNGTGGNVTVEDGLDMMGVIGGNWTVGGVMDVRGGRLCYEYV